MSAPVHGQCNCGNVSFRLEGPLPAMYKCYCTLCQKQSGTASNAATIVKSDAIEWLRGEAAITVWKKDSGFNSHFCTVCGSPVPNPIGDGYIWIPMGSLEPVNAPVVVHLFTESRPSWDADTVEQDNPLVHGVENVAELADVLSKHADVVYCGRGSAIESIEE